MSQVQAPQRTFIKKPDVAVRDTKLELLNNQLKKLNLEIDSIRSKIDSKLNSKDNTTRNELTEQMKEIIKVQSELKQKRNQVFDNLKVLDSKLKKNQAEIDSKLSGVSVGKKYQSIGDINGRLDHIEQEMSTGDLSIVQEKILVKEMASLNKLKKNFVLIEPLKKENDLLKTEIATLKNQLNTELNSKQVSNEFERINKELQTIKSSQNTEQNAKNQLFNKRAALYAKRDEIFGKIKTVRQDFDNEFTNFKLKMEAEKLKREEESKLFKLLEQKESDLNKLNEKLIHAKTPAFTQELASIENTLVVLDPSYEKPKPKTLEFPASSTSTSTSTTAAATSNAEKLVPIVSKKFESTIVVGKGKKGKKSKQSSGSSGKFSLEPSLIGILSELDIDIPISQDDVAKTVEQLKAKHQEYSEHQDEQTKVNIEAVENKIEQVKKAYDLKEEQIRKEVAEKQQKEKEEQEQQE